MTGAALYLSFAAVVTQAAPIHLLLERNTPAGAGNELFLATFATLADLINANAFSSVFTQIDVNDNFNVAGFTALRVGSGGVTIPEPSTLLLVALGLLGVSIAGRRRLGVLSFSVQ
jgi:hypothetical protein